MQLSLGQLRVLLREEMARIEFPMPTFKLSSRDVDTKKFFSQIIEPLKAAGALPTAVGPVIDSGFEGIVCSLGNERVIKLIAAYDMPPDLIANHMERFRNAPTGDMYVKVFSFGTIDAIDPDTDKTYTIVIYCTMERLAPLSDDESQVIFDVANEFEVKPKDVEDERLRDFLIRYMKVRDLDHDVRNVMKRGDQYVVIDP